MTQEHTFRQILARHTARYPALEIQDLYKLIYQAALGSEHAVADASQARVWLEREAAELGEGPEEPVIEPISADGQVVRVNLRPYVAGGGDLNALLEGFLRTAREYRGSEERLRQYGRYAERMAVEGSLGLAADELWCFFEEMAARRFPAVHHSEAYRKAYRPAYRVVAACVVQELFCGGIQTMGASIFPVAAKTIVRFPPDKARDVNPDTHLELTFPGAPSLGTTGQIRIYDMADDRLVDLLDLSIPAGPTTGSTAPRAPYIPAPYEYLPGNFTNANTKPGTPSGGALPTPDTYQLTIIGGFTDGFHLGVFHLS